MTAIETRYLGPTNHQGARIKAWTVTGRSITIPYPHHLSGIYCHLEAARALCKKLGWGPEMGRLAGGETKTGYVFVFTRPFGCTNGFDLDPIAN